MSITITNTFSPFVPLRNVNLSDEEIMDTYWVLRAAFEESHPNNMVDASDAYVLTVFPFKWGDEIPDEYEVEDYATGMVDGEPALCINITSSKKSPSFAYSSAS